MAITVNSINVPMKWESENDYDSHRPLLYHIINNVPHDSFYEFGIGHGSTPLLAHWYEIMKRDYYSYESNEEWVNKFIDGYKRSECLDNFWFKKPHRLLHIEDYMKCSIGKDSIVFIDCAPGELRKDLISKFSGRAKAIIVHDTEVGAEYVYGMAGALSMFKYRVDYSPKGGPRTTAVSNLIDIEKSNIPNEQSG